MVIVYNIFVFAAVPLLKFLRLRKCRLTGIYNTYVCKVFKMNITKVLFSL